jgi:hypothetical protein
MPLGLRQNANDLSQVLFQFRLELYVVLLLTFAIYIDIYIVLRYITQVGIKCLLVENITQQFFLASKRQQEEPKQNLGTLTRVLEKKEKNKKNLEITAHNRSHSEASEGGKKNSFLSFRNDLSQYLSKSKTS